MSELEVERDFYFSKLREIETLCQTHEGEHAIIPQIMDIMYATQVREDAVQCTAT